LQKFSYTKNVIVKGLTVGINWIKFKMKYQINETGEDTELISNPVKIFVYDIGFIDKVPSHPFDDLKDSDNFFLRQHDDEGYADYKELYIYYYILPEGLPISDVKITIREEDEEAENKFVKQIDGEKKTEDNYKTGNELNVKWADVRDAAGNFRENRFYTVQLEVDVNVDVNGVVKTFKTPLGDADTTTPGYQCQEKCLVIHDLVFKHRPVVHMGSGETVAPKGPVYPFSENIVGIYKLEKYCYYEIIESTGEEIEAVPYGIPAWEEPPTNYSNGGFPAAELMPKRQEFSYRYPVLKDSINNDDPDEVKEHYIDVNNNNHGCANGDVTLFHRGHIRHIPKSNDSDGGDYCFIQFWMYETASYAPYGIPIFGNSYWHDCDWEMVQLCIKLTGTKKSEWFLPHAATASQHYYGQTLAWRINKNGPEELAQQYVGTEDNGNRVKIYIAQNSHATYFRDGLFVTETQSCGTQIQYDNATYHIVKDRIDKADNGELVKVDEYTLIPFNYKGKCGIADWPGLWGSNGAMAQAIRGPFLRAAQTSTGNLNLNNKPVDFHNSCRKLIGGKPQTETRL
jgi:hypothetical protein